MGWIFLAIIMLLGIVALSILKTKHDTKIERMRIKGRKDNYTEEQLDEILVAEVFPVPGWVRTSLIGAAIVFLGLGTFHKVFFYAETGYIYHIRTAFNQERVIYPVDDGVGWSYYGFGRIGPWKRAMSIQAARNTGAGTEDQINGGDSTDGHTVSANLLPQNIVFLDQVDADASAMARFRIPTDDVGFLKLAREYRTAENFLNTALIPAFKETLQATASLMSAEEYFSGSRTEFNTEFQAQLENGIYIVKREEILVDDLSQRSGKGSANATRRNDQDEYGDGKKVIFKVIKQVGEDGMTPLRKTQNYVDFGVTVVDARVTEMIPNGKFKDRMDNKQKASADRAIARERRIQEEEQKLLAVAEGERKVAERQAEALVEQIAKTTDAETTKQLILTKALQQKEQAEIDKQTSQIRLEQARIDAKKIKELADANAYEREALLASDNGLKIKTAAIVQMNKDAMAALAQRKVPTTVIYSGVDGKSGLGTNDEIQAIAQTQMLKNLKMLDLDLTVKKGR